MEEQRSNPEVYPPMVLVAPWKLKELIKESLREVLNEGKKKKKLTK